MAKKLKIWNGASWEDVTFAITPPTTNVTNEFTTNQVIDTSTSVAALRITQRGTGEALRVEDDTNPDSSPFIINADGLVGIGTTDFSVRSSTNGGAKIVTNGGMAIINYGDDSSITVARANGTSSSPTQVLANQRIAFLIGSSYYTGATSGFINNTAMNFHAAENITDVARGSFITFDTTNIGAALRSEKMRIDSSGNVGIGTSSPTINTNGKVLHIHSSTASNAAITHYTNAESGSTSTDGLIVGKWSNGTNYIYDYDNYPIIMGTNNAVRFTIGTDGNFTLDTVGGVVYINSSRSVTGANWDQAMLQITGVNAAGYNPGMSWHAPGASAMSIWHPRGSQSLQIMGNVGVVDTASGQMTIRNIAISTSAPSAGNGANGDVWLVYTA